jgi:5-methyltetrahydrofolate--homocysteine methyltransferase
LETLKTAIVEGDDRLAASQAGEALASGLDPLDVLNRGIVPGIQRAGELWQTNQYFLPDVVLSAEAFKAAMKSVEPRLKERQRASVAKRVVIGVVKGDMHDLGKGLVGAMLTAAGFEVTDLGIDVPLEKFVEAARSLKPDILGLGAYMTTTMLQMKRVIAELDQQGLHNGLKVMVGGVPTSQEFADEVGADAWGKDAMDTVRKAQTLAGG